MSISNTDIGSLHGDPDLQEEFDKRGNEICLLRMDLLKEKIEQLEKEINKLKKEKRP